MTNDLDQQLKEYRIADEKTLLLTSAEENCAASVALATQARYSIDIVCRDLEHHLYDNDAFYSAVKKLATSSPKARIRILIQTSDKAIKQGHRLVELARKLSSFIKIRIQGKRFREFNEAWLIVDGKAWIRRSRADSYNAEVNYSAARQLRDTLQQFDTMWNEAVDDPNLRQLSL